MNYFDSTIGTLPERVDIAWADYTYETTEPSQRRLALKFLIYAFDIKKFSRDIDSLNEVLTSLMEKRAQRKEENPNYLPIIHSGCYNFYERSRVLNKTDTYKTSDDRSIQNAFNSEMLLDVTKNERRYDRMTATTYLTARERAAFNLDIYKGKFYQNGKKFDSTDAVAHQKKGYVAFTLNTNGELSVFNHEMGAEDDLERRLVHSSMNAGAPVLVAGEMEIKEGKLISINNYSGHYTPSLFNITLFLEYLSDRDVDVSQVQVLIWDKPSPASHLESTITTVEGSPHHWHSISANSLIQNTDQILDANIATIQSYIESRKTKRKQNLPETQNKIKLLSELTQELTLIKQMMKGSASHLVLRETLNAIEALIERYQEAYSLMRPSGRGRINTLFRDMQRAVHDKKLTLDDSEEHEQSRFEAYKKSH